MKLSEMSKNDKKVEKEMPKNINQAYDELKDCSADELMNRLAKEIQSQKNRGVFDYEGIMASIEKIKTYLPKNTYDNMKRIIDSLK